MLSEGDDIGAGIQNGVSIFDFHVVSFDCLNMVPFDVGVLFGF